MKIFDKESVVTFNKSGSGSKSGRITIPVDWLKFLNIKENDRSIYMELQKDKILIKKLNK